VSTPRWLRCVSIDTPFLGLGMFEPGSLYPANARQPGEGFDTERYLAVRDRNDITRYVERVDADAYRYLVGSTVGGTALFARFEPFPRVPP
jgi:hypothetical protein